MSGDLIIIDSGNFRKIIPKGSKYHVSQSIN